MLRSLAIRNVKRSFKDYLIYIITVTISFGLIFSFNFIALSKDLNELSKDLDFFKYVIIFVSIIVVFVIGWLINYTTKFMFVKRSKEFGTYMLLGIEKKDIKNMFLIENIILGIFSSAISLLIGILFSSILTFVIMNLFDMPYKLILAINPTSILVSITYFILIYIVTLTNISKKIKRINLRHMLYYEKINEQKKINNKVYKISSFIFSLILGIIGLILTDKLFETLVSEYTIILALLSVLCTNLSIYGIIFTLGDFILNIVLKNNKLKYKNDNLFVVRNLTSKVKTIETTLGHIAMLTSITLVCLNFAFLSKDSFDNQTETMIPYDIILNTMYSETDDFLIGYDYEETYNKYYNYIDNTLGIEESHEYNLYVTEIENNLDGSIHFIPSYQISELVDSLDFVDSYLHKDTYIKLSDYNKLNEMLDRNTITLNSNEYYIHMTREELIGVAKAIKDNDYKLEVSNTTLTLKDATQDRFVKGWGAYQFLIVVPDYIVDNMKVESRITAINTKQETSLEYLDEITSSLGIPQVKNYSMNYINYNNIDIRAEALSENRSMITIFSFTFIYISLVFILIIGTIVSIQTLSDSTKYKYRYKLLNKLGIDKQNITKTIRKEISFNFLFPLVYPLVISTIITLSINNRVFGGLTSITNTHIYSLIYSLLIFLSVYGIYYISTYLSFKKNINE